MLKTVEQRVDEGFLLKLLVPVGQVEIRRHNRRKPQAVALVHSSPARVKTCALFTLGWRAKGNDCKVHGQGKWVCARR